jgi:hypothetical protein
MKTAILPVASHHCFCITTERNDLAGDGSKLIDTVREKRIFGLVDNSEKRIAGDDFNRATWRICVGTHVVRQRFSKIVLCAQVAQRCNEEDRNARVQGTQPKVPKQR